MDPELLKIISSLFMIVAVPVLTVLAGYLAAWVKAKIEIAKAELAETQPDLLYWMDWSAKLAVNAAEASGLNGYVKDKKKYALEVANKLLAEKGLTVDTAVLVAAIENAWAESWGNAKLEAAKDQSKKS